MFISNMNHQNHIDFDFVTEKVTQNLKDFSNSRANTEKISNRASNPWYDSK